jgi:hypothetical protein
MDSVRNLKCQRAAAERQHPVRGKELPRKFILVINLTNNLVYILLPLHHYISIQGHQKFSYNISIFMDKTNSNVLVGR